MDQMGYHLPQILIESHSIVKPFPVFHLKAYLRHSQPFRRKSDESWMSSLFQGNSR